MKIHLGYLLGFSAIVLAGCAAFFSVFGLSHLFAGASLSIIIMASALEFSKLVVATYLHSYWSNISKLMRVYLVSGLVILALITSAGIYGYLSNAYQITANKLNIHNNSVGVYDLKLEQLNNKVKNNTLLLESKNNRISQLSDIRSKQEDRFQPNSNNRSNERMVNTTNQTINDLNKEIDILNKENSILSDSIISLTNAKLEKVNNSDVSAELGPLKYMSDITGMTMDSVVNIFILLLVFVFDPLAICLVVATASVFKINGNLNTKKTNTQKLEVQKREEIKQPTPIKTNEATHNIPQSPSFESPKIDNNNSDLKQPKRGIKYEDIKEVKEMQMKDDKTPRNFSKTIRNNNINRYD